MNLCLFNGCDRLNFKCPISCLFILNQVGQFYMVKSFKSMLWNKMLWISFYGKTGKPKKSWRQWKHFNFNKGCCGNNNDYNVIVIKIRKRFFLKIQLSEKFQKFSGSFFLALLFRSRRSEVFYKKGVLKTLAKFARKYLYRRFFFNKVVGLSIKIKKETLA